MAFKTLLDQYASFRIPLRATMDWLWTAKSANQPTFAHGATRPARVDVKKLNWAGRRDSGALHGCPVVTLAVARRRGRSLTGAWETSLIRDLDANVTVAVSSGSIDESNTAEHVDEVAYIASEASLYRSFAAT
jgi:hypothetical protein